jgi:hypothetical protein
MKKENAGRLKRTIAALTVITALGLPVAAQNMSGYTPGSDESGYTLGSGRTENTQTTQSTEAESGVFMGSGTRAANDASTTQTTADSLLTTIREWVSSVF